MKYPDLRTSYLFCAVVHHRGISKAALALGEDERRVGEAVLRLEKFAGQKLIRRSTRYIGPTSLGRAYYENMTPLVASSREPPETSRPPPAGKARVHGYHPR
jgi:DNA-binding transcriptional LysR family regulator